MAIKMNYWDTSAAADTDILGRKLPSTPANNAAAAFAEPAQDFTNPTAPELTPAQPVQDLTPGALSVNANEGWNNAAPVPQQIPAVDNTPDFQKQRFIDRRAAATLQDLPNYVTPLEEQRIRTMTGKRGLTTAQQQGLTDDLARSATGYKKFNEDRKIRQQFNREHAAVAMNDLRKVTDLNEYNDVFEKKFGKAADAASPEILAHMQDAYMKFMPEQAKAQLQNERQARTADRELNQINEQIKRNYQPVTHPDTGELIYPVIATYDPNTGKYKQMPNTVEMSEYRNAVATINRERAATQKEEDNIASDKRRADRETANILQKHTLAAEQHNADADRRLADYPLLGKYGNEKEMAMTLANIELAKKELKEQGLDPAIWAVDIRGRIIPRAQMQKIGGFAELVNLAAAVNTKQQTTTETKTEAPATKTAKPAAAPAKGVPIPEGLTPPASGTWTPASYFMDVEANGGWTKERILYAASKGFITKDEAMKQSAKLGL